MLTKEQAQEIIESNDIPINQDGEMNFIKENNRLLYDAYQNIKQIARGESGQLDPIVIQPILSASVNLLRFTKHNDYPKEFSKEFDILTNKLDILETELRRAGIITGKLEAV